MRLASPGLADSAGATVRRPYRASNRPIGFVRNRPSRLKSIRSRPPSVIACSRHDGHRFRHRQRKASHIMTQRLLSRTGRGTLRGTLALCLLLLVPVWAAAEPVPGKEDRLVAQLVTEILEQGHV